MLKKSFNKFFNLHFLNKKYIVNKEAGVVVCVITAKLNIINTELWWDSLIENFLNKRGPYEFVGVAKCHKDDVFDEQKGKYIAESKAKYKLYSNTETLLKKAFGKLRSTTDAVLGSINLYNSYKDRELAHIDEVAHR